ncbi:MAG: alpha/beta hydrolase [Pseudomonadota bacterium]
MTRITDWDDAYANRDHIPGADAFIARWTEDAAAFRAARPDAALDQSYGPAPRQRFDLFVPTGAPRGLVVFVHGGYWRAFDKSYWSHLAAGALDHGWAVAMPSYTLAPQATLAQIAVEIGQAIGAAASRVAGPVHLAGHSAGGHLVTRMACIDTPLPQEVASRLALTLSISGVHDLRPLLRTDINADLYLTPESAAAESPALHMPRSGTRLIAWVGGAERPEFLRQTALIANIWSGLGADTAHHIAPDRHHFDVIDGLRDPASPLTRALLAL